MASDVALAGATLSLSQTVSAYAFFLPPITEVRKAGKNDPDMIGDVRMGQVAAGALSIGIGAIMSNLTQSPLPVVISLMVGLILFGLYETALRGERVFNG